MMVTTLVSTINRDLDNVEGDGDIFISISFVIVMKILKNHTWLILWKE